MIVKKKRDTERKKNNAEKTKQYFSEQFNVLILCYFYFKSVNIIVN